MIVDDGLEPTPHLVGLERRQDGTHTTTPGTTTPIQPLAINA